MPHQPEEDEHHRGDDPRRHEVDGDVPPPDRVQVQDVAPGRDEHAHADVMSNAGRAPTKRGMSRAGSAKARMPASVHAEADRGRDDADESEHPQSRRSTGGRAGGAGTSSIMPGSSAQSHRRPGRADGQRAIGLPSVRVQSPTRSTTNVAGDGDPVDAAAPADCVRGSRYPPNVSHAGVRRASAATHASRNIPSA